MSTNPIAIACRLLREGAEELKNCHTLAATGHDWTGEPEAKAAYDESMAAADALESWADSIGAGGVEALRGRQCLHRIAEPAGEYPALPEIKDMNNGPQQLNLSDRAMWVIGWNECRDAVRDADRAMRAAQPAPAYKDSTPELRVGDSAFESWYDAYTPAHKSDKQRARDAYAAGMGDPLVMATPAAVAGPSDPMVGAILGAAYDFRDAHISGSMNQKRSAHAELESIVRTALAAAPTTQPAPQQETTEDVDGKAFRTAARLGMTLRFYGGCAQSSMPGSPSAYEVSTGRDRAAAMRDAVERAEAVIARGGEAQRIPAPQQEAQHLAQALTDRENQPNQYGVEFGMSGTHMHFKIGNQLFKLAYEPDEQEEFDFMKRMLVNAFTTFTHDVKTAPQPSPAAQGDALTQAARDVLAERQRQINAEGWTPGHDDEHDEGELCYAAAGYAVAASNHIQAIATGIDDALTMDNDTVSPPNTSDPWPADWTFKPCPPRRALVKSGALILAELERMDRADAARTAQEGK